MHHAGPELYATLVPFPLRNFSVLSAGFSPLVAENGLKPALRTGTRETFELETALELDDRKPCDLHWIVAWRLHRIMAYRKPMRRHTTGIMIMCRCAIHGLCNKL